MEGSDLTGTKQGKRNGTVGWRIPTSDDSILQVRNCDYHPGYRHRRDRIKMMCILRLADGSVRRDGSLAAAHLIHCARRTIRAATICRGTSHHRRNIDAERKEHSDQKDGDKAHGHHRNPDQQNSQQTQSPARRAAGVTPAASVNRKGTLGDMATTAPKPVVENEKMADYAGASTVNCGARAGGRLA